MIFHRQTMTESVLTLSLIFIATASSAFTSSSSSSSCPDAIATKLQTCLDQVERDESVLPGGPCSSLDWRCICTKQQGLADCFTVCPSDIPADTANFDKNNCAGQHDGITINSLGGDLMYTWSDLNVALAGTPDGNMQFPPNTSTSSSNSIPLSSTNMTDNTNPSNSTTATSTSNTSSSISVARGCLESQFVGRMIIPFFLSISVSLL